MADIDYNKMQDAFERALRARGYSGGGGGGSGGFSPSRTESGSQSLTTADLKAAMEKVKDGASSFVDTISESTNTWRGLSKTGSNFSNDIIGMTAAAHESRLSLGEFADVVAQNGKNLAGLGGSVTRGTEAFAKVSKGFFEGDFSKQLQNMGYTAKDLNEVLAVQLGTQRTTFKDTEQGRKQAYESAQALAKEMDMIAKLTGKNREQQMEEAKKRAADGQVEAKLRLIGIEQGAEAEAAARAAFQKQFAEAEARGMGQMAKEMFATGTLTSNEAATQYALMGEAAQKTGDQMRFLSEGNIKAAEAASKQADAANAKNQRDPTLLRLATLGDAAGTAGMIMKKNVEDNMALHDSVMAVSKSMKPGLLTSTEDFGKALTKVRNDIELSRMGVDARGRQVSGATQGVVAAQRAAQEIRAGVAGAAMAENAKGESIAGAARRTGAAAAETLDRVSGPGSSLGGNIRRAAERGQQPETVEPREGEGALQLKKRQEEAAGGIIGGGTKLASEAANATVSALEKAVLKVRVIGVMPETNRGTPAQQTPAQSAQSAPTPAARRQGGSLEMTGNIFENWGKGTLVELHGMEGVVRPEDLEKLVGMSMKSMTTGMTDFAKGMNDLASMEPTTETLDLSKISKDISTTISAAPGAGVASSADKVLASIDEAIAKKEEALAKVNKMLNEGSDEELNSAWEEFEKAKEQLTSVIDSAMTGISSSFEGLTDNFDETMSKMATDISDAIPTDITRDLAQLRIDEAKQAHDVAKAEVTKLLNDETASDEDINAAYEKYKETFDNLNKVVDESMQDLVQSYDDIGKISLDISDAIPLDEFGDLEGAMKKVANDMFPDTEFGDLEGAMKKAASPKKAINPETGEEYTPVEATPAARSIDLSKINLPGFGPQLKSAQAAIPAAVTKSAEAKAGESKTTETKTAEAKAAEAKAGETKAGPGGGKAATLDDVVKSLDQLNMFMGKLLNQTEELGRKQINATRANSSNVLAR